MPEPPSADDIARARERIAGAAVRTPLVRLEVDGAPAEIHLKLENLQPVGAFKIRGAVNALASTPAQALEGGVFTASAGNMGRGVAWAAARIGVPFTTIVPDHAPEAKLDPMRRLGGRIVKVPFDEWWQVLVTRSHPAVEGFFVHSVADPAVIAGNATVGAEILEDLPEVDTVVVPFGGGGLSTGIASALRAAGSPARVLAAEVATAAPLAAALKAGRPTPIEYIPSFVDGIGSGVVLDEMWPLVSELISGSIVVGLDDVAAAVRTLAERNRVVAEGAGAAGVAAALGGGAGTGTVVCVVSGGNIDLDKLADILAGS